MELDFYSIKKEYENYENTFFELLSFTFNFLKYKMDPIVSISIVDNKTIHALNKKYRKIDRPTDVLSFAFMDNDIIDKKQLLNNKETYCLGEIFISYQKAEEQSKEYGHSFSREMCFLFIHGLLHLCGYDHMEKEDEQEMFNLQKEILNAKGILR